MFKPASDRMPQILQLFGALVLLLWLLGVHTATVAKIGLGLAIVAHLAFFKVRSTRFDLSKAASWHLVFVFFWLLLLFGYQFAQVHLGRQGFDFAIFSDVFLHFAKSFRLDSVLLGDVSKSFLTHHFSPLLVVPGAFAWLGLSPQMAAILVHCVCTAIGLYVLWEFAKRCGLASAGAAFCLMLLTLNPTFRIGLSWEVHEETFALPLVGLSYLFWFRKQHGRAALSLVACMLAKETFFFFAIAFSCMAFFWAYWHKESRRALGCYIVVSFLAAIGIWFYVFYPPEWFGKTFNATARLSTFEHLFSLPTIEAKVNFLIRLLLPFLMAPFWSKRAALVAMPALAFLGPILLSNFENMYHSYNYYGVIPTFIFAFAALVGIQDRFPAFSSIVPALYVVLICLPLRSGGPVRPLRTILELNRSPWLSAEQLSGIPAGSKLVAQDYDVQFLLGRGTVYREWTAERLDLPWTHLVVRKSAKEEFSSKLIAQSAICQDLPNWIIRCRLE